MINRRPTGRQLNEIRPVEVRTQVNRYAEGSCLISFGNTQVLCTASIEKSVPGWLEKSGSGWVTAEYSMLPRSTHTRNKRDREKVSGRTQEIQRLIGRALRATLDLKSIPERSIVVDCDVLQADGGTRTAAITGGCIALGIALKTLNLNLKSTVCAISAGILGETHLLDLDYEEDSSCDSDTNFVFNGHKNLIEIQGTAEKNSFSPEDLNKLLGMAQSAASILIPIQIDAIRAAKTVLP